ncbi:iron-containing alcohol dehydrogenase [Cetobacterium sp. SF1]|uniref:iron-containing alcohol dehydrogenase n=1 Tax=unclassified Cetobacterium TaxID=2630983 RepID=UPI003CF1DA20
MSYNFYMPTITLIGENALEDLMPHLKKYQKALIVTDKVLVEIGLVKKLTDLLEKEEIKFCIFDETKPNPTVKNVNDGLSLLEKEKCDFIISFGGGSPHDAAKGIALLKTNGGSIKDYEGVDKSKHPQYPLISINTTAGTASEMTRFSIITDEDRHIKMAIVDKHVTPLIAVNDPKLMVAMPKGLTAATGMDALTHAVEAMVSTAANPLTDACAAKAIALIAKYLKRAVDNGEDLEARDKMSYAEYLAGMAFNNASLGYVHAMAHQLGGFYDLPHGVCNAVLLPHVQEFNKETCNKKLKSVAHYMGINTSGMSDDEGAIKAIEAIKELSKSIGIPGGLKELNVNEKDLPTLAKNAAVDACGITNPKKATIDEIIKIYMSAM